MNNRSIYEEGHYREAVERGEDAMRASCERVPSIPYTSAERRWEADNPVFVFDKSKIGSEAPKEPYDNSV